MKTIVVIPTYDEKDNVRPMAEAVLNCGADGERRTGYSKITFGIAVESFKMALRLRRG